MLLVCVVLIHCALHSTCILTSSRWTNATPRCHDVTHYVCNDIGKRGERERESRREGERERGREGARKGREREREGERFLTTTRTFQVIKKV